ncbi:MAG: hypothetical protein HQK62_09950 [Desulfamplus sp.]|nr:hypothetical protein [Desulfamplus sp.]MBF0259145.1 hypothetical protein [Desulfamplus sp.]
MNGISINGRYLHELRMPLVPYKNINSVVSLSYPKNRILFEQYGEGMLKLTIPSLLALEMYRVGLLPQDANNAFSVSISGKPIGNYKVVDFLYQDSSMHDGIVFITLKKQ